MQGQEILVAMKYHLPIDQFSRKMTTKIIYMVLL